MQALTLSAMSSPDWLRNSVGYEVYIRSFADGDGDGVGDLTGLRDRLEYLAWLGVDLVWVTPFFPSPMADHGYDVADYADIDPLFGNLDEFDRLIARAHELGLKVAVDIVPNHTSSAHPWFRAAFTDPESRYRAYYLWRDPAPGGGPPNNWISHFGGPAWTFEPRSGQYYCHLFLPEQPDLNWRNPDVREEFERILEFWFRRDTDAIRIDVAHALIKDEQFRDNRQVSDPAGLIEPRERFRCFDHVHDLCRPEVLDIYRSWHKIAERYDAALIGETYVREASELSNLVTDDGLHVGFWFAPMSMPWKPEAVREMLEAPHRAIGSQVGWVQSSHDERRPVARFSGGDIGRRRSLGFCLMLMGMPGTPFLYQGEELGLDDARIPMKLRHDPVARRNRGSLGRDVCRSPMPWDDKPNLGFSTAATTWLPQVYRYDESVAAQRKNPKAHLHKVRGLVNLRRTLSNLGDTVRFADDLPDGVVAFYRDDHFFALNVNETLTELDLSGLRVIHRTISDSVARPVLEPDEALVAVRS